MSVLLTSFKQAEDLPDHIDVWSSAVYQPKWLPQRPKAKWMDIRRPDGVWIRPREHVERDQPLNGYFTELIEHYHERIDRVYAWAESAGAWSTSIAVACWCPYDKAAKRQIEEWGTFVCHTAAVEVVLREIGVEVTLDDDREKMVRFW